MAFRNRVRLPMKITRPQFPEERQSYRKANGEVQTLSVVVRKTYEGETDYFPEIWHQRLKIALAHDEVRYEGEKYLGLIAQDGEYSIEWPDFLDYPTAKAAFTVEATPFNATNANCQSCEQTAQAVLVDDYFPAPLAEGGSFNILVADNDSICCYPALFELTSFNSDFIASASINPVTGLLAITLKDPLISGNEILLATYRVTCPNGGFDEANVYADIDGSLESCLAPVSVILEAAAPNELTFTWVAPSPAPVGGYDWDIRKASAPGVIIQSEVGRPLTNVIIASLEPDTEYIFNVRSHCDDDSFSNYIQRRGKTTPYSNTCGQYQVTYNNGSGRPADSTNIGVRECDGVFRGHLIYNMTSIIVCALQTAPGSPVQIVTYPNTTVLYLGTCGTPVCNNYQNNQDAPIFVQYTDCGGTVQTGSMQIGDILCAQSFSIGGSDLTVLGPC